MSQYSAVGNLAMICVKRFSALLGFFRYKYLYFECYATMPIFADAHTSSLGYLCTDQKQSPRNRRKARWEDGNILLSAIKPKRFIWGDPFPR